jgi:hypothetical protein
MDRVEVDGYRLSWETDPGGALLEVLGSTDRLTSPTGRLTFRFAARDRRLGVGLGFPPTSRVIDVSNQPAVFEQVLPVGRGPCQPGSCGSILARWVATLAGLSSGWRPAEPDDLGVPGTVGGVAFPLLGAAYERGAEPLREIPRWAAPVLAHSTARAAAQCAFGPKATRSVVGALASSLVQGPTRAQSNDACEQPGWASVGLLQLALALIGEPVLEPDHIVLLLGQSELRHGPDAWPTGEEIADCRALAADLGPTRTLRLLCDATGRADGPQLLVQTMALFSQVRHHLPRRFASRLEDLRDQCLDQLPVDPHPEQPRFRPRRASNPSTATRRRAVPRLTPPDRPRRFAPVAETAPPAPADRVRRVPDVRGRALLPPPGHDRDPTSSGSLAFPPSIAGLAGVVVGGHLRLVLPRTSTELATWGQRLGNCIGSFGPAVAAGRSWLIGVEVESRLAYCMELTPNGSIRQFLGVRNRPVPQRDARAVCVYLLSVGVVDPHNPANRAWLE